jgi:hypothetical protein
LELADRADDSHGNVGQLRRDAWHTYLGLDWQAAGMRAEDSRADLCDLVVFEGYALGYQEETLPWQGCLMDVQSSSRPSSWRLRPNAALTISTN